MIEIKSIDDLSQLPSDLAEWLKQENPYLSDDDWEPMEAGYLIILDANDNVRRLKINIEALVDLNQIDCWEWTAFNEKLRYYCACVILDDGFGMVFAIPENNVISNEVLQGHLKSCLAG